MAKIKQMIELVKNNNDIYISIGGDALNHATTVSASSVFDESTHGIDQILLLRDLLKPIKEKILFIRSGNHGQSRALRHNKIPPEQVLAELLDVPYLTGIATVMINCRKNCYVISSIHANKKPDKLEFINADITYIEHVHQNMYEKRLVMLPNKHTKRWICRPSYYVYAGTTLGWGGYGAESGYRPVATGYPVIELCGIKEKWNIYLYDNIDNFIRFHK